MGNGWTRYTDAGWLQNKPSYEKGNFYIAQDYDNLDDSSEGLKWFVHNEMMGGFLQAYDTLGEAMASVDEK